MTCHGCGAPGATFVAGPRIRFCTHTCFCAWDAREEAAEVGVIFNRALDVDLPVVGPRMRLLREVEDLRGRRFGKLVALQLVARERPVRGVPRARREWLCECECGRELLATATRLARGLGSCRWCAAAATAAKRRARVDGVDIAEIARATGLTLDGVRERLRRGVSGPALLAPRTPDGFGRRRAA